MNKKTRFISTFVSIISVIMVVSTIVFITIFHHPFATNTCSPHLVPALS